MRSSTDRQPTPIYMEVLDTIARGEKPTPEQLDALEDLDPVVKIAVDTAMHEFLKALKLLIKVNEYCRQQEQQEQEERALDEKIAALLRSG
jgi:hypothetical protein